MQKITPFLWFDTEAKQAADFYISVFPNSKMLSSNILENSGPNEDQRVEVYEFELNGSKFNAMSAGPLFKFNESISFLIDCEDQKEVDYYWEKLTANGGQEVQCGWLKDKYGLSWQVVPKILNELLADPDKEKSQRVLHAMLKMIKIDVEGLKRAYRGE